MTLAVVIVDDAPGVHLAGRPALEWLLDTVEQLSPTVVVAAGAARAAVAARPALAGGLDCTEPCAATLYLPASSPLLLARTLQDLLARLDGRAALAVLEAPTRWWDPDGREPRRVVALAGPPPAGSLADASSAHTNPADASSAHINPADASSAHTIGGDVIRAVIDEEPVLRIGGVEALWTGDPYERVAAQNALYTRIAVGWIEAGVSIDDPATTRIDATVRIDAGARIGPHTELLGSTSIGAGSRIGPVATVRDCSVGRDCVVHYSVCQDTRIGDGANIGPFAWVRSGSLLGDRTRVGAFVEIADSSVGDGTAVPHLAGLFSADVGRDCNVASMAGSLNFNGGVRQRTRIGDGVSIGSGTLLIAPVSVGDRAETAAGSVITEDVPDGALAIARTPQRNVTGWAALRDRRR